jgi:hypothetical protein
VEFDSSFNNYKQIFTCVNVQWDTQKSIMSQFLLWMVELCIAGYLSHLTLPNKCQWLIPFTTHNSLNRFPECPLQSWCHTWKITL